MTRHLKVRRLFYLAVVVLTASAAHASGSSPATTYYVSSTGSDANAGTAASPWRTVSRVNRAALAPGTRCCSQAGNSSPMRH